jgi:hypothetical protein
MIKKITTKWLNSHSACYEAVEKFKKQKECDPIKLLRLMIRSNHKEILEWANWLIVRIMNKKQRVEYAKSAAWYATNSAAFSGAFSAESAKYAAKSAAWYAAKSALSAELAALSAAQSAGYAEYKNTLIKILKHGIKVLKLYNNSKRA